MFAVTATTILKVVGHMSSIIVLQRDQAFQEVDSSTYLISSWRHDN